CTRKQNRREQGWQPERNGYKRGMAYSLSPHQSHWRVPGKPRLLSRDRDGNCGVRAAARKDTPFERAGTNEVSALRKYRRLYRTTRTRERYYWGSSPNL